MHSFAIMRMGTRVAVGSSEVSLILVLALVVRLESKAARDEAVWRDKYVLNQA